ncbi:MAG TPA: hypothetical protein VFB78_16240 [Acidimicrobiales bacterium]|nr:hypothetical protein [Acidimicrobiales bacterium]
MLKSAALAGQRIKGHGRRRVVSVVSLALAAVTAAAFATFNIGGAEAAAPNSQLLTPAFSTSSDLALDRTFPLVLNNGGVAHISSNADGSGNINADDIMVITVTRENGTEATVVHTFNNEACTTDVPSAPITIPALPGNNVVRVIIANNENCGLPSGALSNLYMAVNSQPTTVRAKPIVLELLAPTPPLVTAYPLNLTAKLTETATVFPISSRTLSMHAGDASGAVICTAVTDADGQATCGGLVEDLTAILAFGWSATFAGDAFYLPSAGSAPLIDLGGTAILPLP